MSAPVAVVGGAGRVGRLVVNGLFAQGAEVHVVSRRPGRATELARRGAQLFEADVRSGDGLRPALAGVRAVVYSVEPGLDRSGPNRPETTMYQGIVNVLDACGSGIERFVLVSQIYVTRSGHPINEYGRVLDWRLRGEDALRGSGAPYTIVRPGWLTDRAGGGGLRLEQGDQGDGEVSRADVAEACLHALTEPAAAGKTFEIYHEAGRAPATWAERFAALAPDPVHA